MESDRRPTLPEIRGTHSGNTPQQFSPSTGTCTPSPCAWGDPTLPAASALEKMGAASSALMNAFVASGGAPLGNTCGAGARNQGRGDQSATRDGDDALPRPSVKQLVTQEAGVTMQFRP